MIDLPPELIAALKKRAREENREVAELVAEAIRRHFCALAAAKPAASVRDIAPVSVGSVTAEKDLSEDRMGDMLDARGRRY